MRRLDWLTEDGSPRARFRLDLVFAVVLVPAFCLVLVAFGAAWSSVVPVLAVWGVGGVVVGASRYAIRKRRQVSR